MVRARGSLGGVAERTGFPSNIRRLAQEQGEAPSVFTDNLTDLGDETDTGPDAFVETAAILVNLDLLISSDTAIVHLAGALGVETWVPLNTPADWRWGLEGDTTPSYPSLRLFRQGRARRLDNAGGKHPPGPG